MAFVVVSMLVDEKKTKLTAVVKDSFRGTRHGSFNVFWHLTAALESGELRSPAQFTRSASYSIGSVGLNRMFNIISRDYRKGL